jgi:hypothetical protein
MENKKKLNFKGNSHILLAEFWFWEWSTKNKVPMSLHPMLMIKFVNKELHSQHCLQCWGLNQVPHTSSVLLIESCPQHFCFYFSLWNPVFIPLPRLDFNKDSPSSTSQLSGIIGLCFHAWLYESILSILYGSGSYMLKIARWIGVWVALTSYTIRSLTM